MVRDGMKMDSFKYMLAALVDVVMPRTCIVCGKRLELNEKSICIYCYSDMPLTRFEQRSRNPMADRLNDLIEKGRVADGCRPEPYSYAVALFYYSQDACYRKVPYQIKYEGNIQAGLFFGRMLGQKLISSPYMKGIDVVIPVPLHWMRRFRRGYNQAAVIASEVANCLGAELRTDILKRKRRTKTQTRLSVDSKIKNVSGAFRVDNVMRTNMLSHLLLVDDVFTTGSTVYSCFKALRSVFPSDVRISVACLGFVG